jgi:DNA-binding NtrC family response regulator
MKDTVILVDDNEDLLSTFSAILEKQGYKVHVFSKVGKAAKFLKSSDTSGIQAIISDVLMGPIDGIDFLSFVKSVPDLAKIDFYLMTGAVVPVLEPLYRPYNIKKIMQKPFSARELVSTLKEN